MYVVVTQLEFEYFSTNPGFSCCQNQVSDICMCLIDVNEYNYVRHCPIVHQMAQHQASMGGGQCGEGWCMASPHPRGHSGGAGHGMKEEMKIERLAVLSSADLPWRTSYRQMKFARGKIVSTYRFHPGVGES